MNGLKLSSCMGDNADAFCRAAAACLGAELSLPVDYVDDIPWRERERRFDLGLIQICWICGWPYVMKADNSEPNVELLGAPVPAGARYSNRPIYFSDIVVRRDSPFRDFFDLYQTRWAYNEPFSHSGYNLVRSHLFSLGATNGYFASVVESGAHAVSLRMVRDGTVDASAIDSTVLEWEVALRPELLSEIRIIGTLGPSPVPPWVVSKSVPAGLRGLLARALLNMHRTEEGRAALALGSLARFSRVVDGDYDPIREMAGRAAQVVGL